jgi:hypothetical protein
MKKIFNLVVLSALLFGLCTFAGCSKTTKIGDILASPAQYQNKTISVEGTVGDTSWFAIAGKGAYQIGDGSGTIWVITNQPPPQQGALVSAQGKVQSAFTILERSFGTVLVETGRNLSSGVASPDK